VREIILEPGEPEALGVLLKVTTSLVDVIHVAADLPMISSGGHNPTRKKKMKTYPIKRRRGQKTLLTPALRKRLTRFLSKGHTIKASCEACGHSERSYFDWCNKDASFLAATLRARTAGKIKIVESILVDKDWRARAWYLERCFPAEFGRTKERNFENADQNERSMNWTMLLDTGGKTLEELLDFPIKTPAPKLPPSNNGDDEDGESLQQHCQ
jgi:hypothetical protein